MIHFVGAGPGAVDLISVRGAEYLRKADVVIYAGSLVNPGLLDYCNGAEVYNSAYMTLEEVIAVMKKADEDKKDLVRLHTGEPSIYGAVKEQMDELEKLNIEYDSCPGISACFAAAASLDLEFTLPGVSQSLIITRMEGKTEVPSKESIESLASHNASMAIYLSAGMLGELSKRLIRGGYKADTSAAIVYKAGMIDEKKIICTVGGLETAAQKYKITKTAVILVGDVINAEHYEKSKLYSADFSTEFRKAAK